MFVELHPTESGLTLDGPIPPLLAPLLDAGRRGLALEAPVQSIVEALGFDSFILAFTVSHAMRNDGKYYFCTSVPLAWVAEYNRRSYIEIDPRSHHCWNKLTPLIWDRRIGLESPAQQEFLDNAARFGVGSGVCMGLRGDPHSHAMLALNARERDVDDAKARYWASKMGDITLLAVHFHAIFARDVVERGIEPLHQGRPLSARERECLSLCAKGQTSADIALKLSISERTVNFHVSNVMSKLGAVNRQEAVALAVGGGIIGR